ncbi:MAG: insulinase family protein [Candidatus Omnitrophota bacterium]|nr:MAG: insulinase family protein [Candidatus Omnitrophota bacterium]
MYNKKILDNGLKIISHLMPDKLSVAVGVWIKVGGRYEPFKLKGIAHYLEHLIFKGSKKYSCRKIKESIEGVGGSLNGFTSEELTCFLAKVPRQYLGLALDILTDMTLNPLLRREEVEKERAVILEEIKMYIDQPRSHKYELLDELLWPNQPLGMPIIGTVTSVSGINREKLHAFQKQYYTASNIIISVAGAFNQNKLVKNIADKFRIFKPAVVTSFSHARQEQDKPRFKLLHKATEQTHLAIGFHGLDLKHPLRFALSLLNIILGANMSSRLFNELREKRGLAYEIGTQVKYFLDTGAFIIHAGIDNRKVSESIALILKELRKLKTNPVTKSEFRRARDFFKGQIMLALEDTLDHMLWVGESTATLDKVFTLKDIIREVDRISPGDLRKLAKDIFREKSLNLALIGPLQEKEIQKTLKLN